MIQINLLDQTQSRGRSRRAGAAKSGGGSSSGIGGVVVAIVALGMVALNGGVAWTCYKTVHDAGEDARVAKGKLKTIEDQIAATYQSSEQIRTFEQVVNNQKEVLETLDPPDRVLWCEKINMLANLIPTKVFVSKIEVVEAVEMIETKESIEARKKWEAEDKEKRGPEPEAVKRPVIHYDIAVTGLATGESNVEQFDNVMAFHKAIISHEWTDDYGAKHRFMDGFVDNVDFGVIEATNYDGVPVNQFVFKLRTLNQGGEDKKPSVEDTKAVASAEPTPGQVRRQKLDEVIQ